MSLKATGVTPGRGLEQSHDQRLIWVKQALWAIAGAAFVTLCAKIKIPSWPVPMTMHTFAVLGIAVATGPRLATATLLAYLGAGALGLPVFSGTPERGIGLAYMMGPTGGYLLGFLIASTFTSLLASGRGLPGQVLAMLAGLAVIYAAGLSWLGLFVPADRLLALGFTPFILSDLLSIAMVCAVGFVVPAKIKAWLP